MRKIGNQERYGDVLDRLGLHNKHCRLTITNLFPVILYRNKLFITRMYAGGWSDGNGDIYETKVTVRDAMSRT
jgi:hypothetical protein